MELHDLTFKRRFSINFHGNLRLKQGEMSFYKDFIHDRRGDPYPLMGGTHYGCGSCACEGIVEEQVACGKYTVCARRGSFTALEDAMTEDGRETGTLSDAEISEKHDGQGLFNGAENGNQAKRGGAYVKRLMGGFFPWNIYEIDFTSLSCGGIGMTVESTEGNLSVLLRSCGVLEVDAEGNHFEFDVVLPQDRNTLRTLTVSFRAGAMSVYLGKYGNHTQKICDLRLPTLDLLRSESALHTAHAYLLTAIQCGGEIVVERAEWFLSAGLSQADLRAVKYENGEVMVRDGRIFLTASARLETESYQVVLSWDPTLCDFRLEGTLLFDCGDGVLCGDVASSIIYDRSKERWLIWMCMFSHGHFLGRAETTHCPLYGINYIDVVPMESASDPDELTAFKGFRGDEDPDLVKIGDKWHLAVCRLVNGKYKYYHFVSDDPLDGFTYVNCTAGSEKTGGSFVLCHDGKICFVCGSDFSKRAVYDVYPVEDFTVCGHLKCDFDDGGFRGWGTVMLLPFGTRRRYTWITFDRHNATAYNWSYGNLYVFDSESFR